MKKLIAISLTMLSFVSVTMAQTDRNISVAGQRTGVVGNNMSVELDVAVGWRAAKSGHTIVYRPYLTDGNYSWTLPEIIVQGRRARIAQERGSWAAGGDIRYNDPVFVRNGERFLYTASAPRQQWMDGAVLMSETVDMDCCGGPTVTTAPSPVAVGGNSAPVSAGYRSTTTTTTARTGAAAGSASAPVSGTGTVIVLSDKPAVEQVYRPSGASATTGEKLAATETYVLPASGFDRSLPSSMFDLDREDALAVYFDVGSARLDPYGNGNSATMRRLLASIRELQDSPDSRVSRIVVAGFASPEGGSELNDRLAYNRAAALKRYIARNSTIPGDRIQIYNGAEDWQGLRAMVEGSGMPNAYRITDIIDNVPVRGSYGSAGREEALKRLDGGRTYHYMLQNFFPELRKAAYIKIFYENR